MAAVGADVSLFKSGVICSAAVDLAAQCYRFVLSFGQSIILGAAPVGDASTQMETACVEFA